MTPRTLRRKLQKKAKHKPYRKCGACGGRMTCEVRGVADEPCKAKMVRWRLFKKCHDCKSEVELFWSGGGIGRHIPRAEK